MLQVYLDGLSQNLNIQDALFNLFCKLKNESVKHSLIHVFCRSWTQNERINDRSQASKHNFYWWDV